MASLLRCVMAEVGWLVLWASVSINGTRHTTLRRFAVVLFFCTASLFVSTALAKAQSGVGTWSFGRPLLGKCAAEVGAAVIIGSLRRLHKFIPTNVSCR
jgi:hypothetical protein